MGTTGTARLQRRRIIERRRLEALLDASKAPVKLLVAPAGYGKTTLAEHWVESGGRRGAWFVVRRSSRDVAALALSVARVSSSLVPGCDERLREHLRAVSAAAESPDTLAELLGEDLGGWPADAWLVLDQYHEIAGARDAERFIETLVSASPIQALIATRQRPSWVTTRALLYGDVLELNQVALAMDSSEAAEVLGDEGAGAASGLVALAGGWPAVIGMAAVSSADLAGDWVEASEALYRFFAEEVFEALGDEVQEGLAILSLAPVLDRDLASALLADDADAVIARRWCWRQSAASAANDSSTDILVTVEGHHDTASEDVARAVDDLEGFLDDVDRADHAGAEAAQPRDEELLDADL